MEGFSGDGGPAINAQLSYPEGITVDSEGNIYVADGNRIRKVSGGGITTVAGDGMEGFSGDGGPAINARLDYPLGIAVDSVGNLYIADSINGRIRKVSNGIITTVAGNGQNSFSGSSSGPATGIALSMPQDVTVDGAGTLYIASTGEISKMVGGQITTIVLVDSPSGVAVDSTGRLYIAEITHGIIQRFSNGTLSTVVGSGVAGFGGDDGPSYSAHLAQPMAVAMASTGELYIADTVNRRVRRVSNGVITTVAGSGPGFDGGGGPAIDAKIGFIYGITTDTASNVYIADGTRIRKISNGLITTVAGSDGLGFGGDDGPATSAQLKFPLGMAVDFAGNLYIADSGNYRVRKVSNGVITTVAGNGRSAFSGDGGPAVTAALANPTGVAIDAAGNLYVADGAHIRKVSNGVITTVAETESSGNWGIAVDSTGNLYTTDPLAQRVRKISGNIVTEIACTGASGGFSGDGGPARTAMLFKPQGISLDSAGRLYIADFFNNRVRILTPSRSRGPRPRRTDLPHN